MAHYKGVIASRTALACSTVTEPLVVTSNSLNMAPSSSLLSTGSGPVSYIRHGVATAKFVPQCMLKLSLRYRAAGGILLPAVWTGSQPGSCGGQLAFVRGVQLSLPAARCYLLQGCLTRGTARQQSSHLEQVPELVLLHVCIGLLLRVRSHAVGRRAAIAQVWSNCWSISLPLRARKHSQRADAPPCCSQSAGKDLPVVTG